jgi:hypothetical protein
MSPKGKSNNYSKVPIYSLQLKGFFIFLSLSLMQMFLKYNALVIYYNNFFESHKPMKFLEVKDVYVGMPIVAIQLMLGQFE